MAPDQKLRLGPLSLEGKDLFSYLGWFVAVGFMAYAVWGPTADIKAEQVRQGLAVKAVGDDMAVVKADVADLKDAMGLKRRRLMADGRVR